MSTALKTESKKIKVKFNTNTAILLRPELVNFCDAPESVKYQVFNASAYKPVQIDQIVEITEAQYNQFYKDPEDKTKGIRTVTLGNGKFGNLSKELANLKEQFKNSPEKFDPAIEKEFVATYTVPICEIVA